MLKKIYGSTEEAYLHDTANNPTSFDAFLHGSKRRINRPPENGIQWTLNNRRLNVKGYTCLWFVHGCINTHYYKILFRRWHPFLIGGRHNF
jgi:hypothetical protein